MEAEKKYCAAPWRGLHLNFDGFVKTCCAGAPRVLQPLEGEENYTSDTTIEAILEGPGLAEVRASIKKGILHPRYCANCIKSEDAGFNSERDWHNNLSPDFNYETTNIYEHVPRLIDVRWNNTCNLACNYCDSHFSTKWASIIGAKVNQTIKTEYKQIIDYIEKHSMHVKEVAMVGGEPLMMKENDALLDILPDDVLVTVITNMTNDFDKMPVPQKLLNRSRVGWSMSFDNIGERFEYVRWGSTWKRLDENVTRVANKINNSNHHGGIQAVYNLYNCTRLCELKQYSLDKKITILWQHIHGDQLDPTKHNQAVRELALAEIQKFRDTFDIIEAEETWLENLEELLLQGNGNLDKEFKDMLCNVEDTWHPDQKGKFVKLWPELVQPLGL